jgi:hypothetical protein
VDIKIDPREFVARFIRNRQTVTTMNVVEALLGVGTKGSKVGAFRILHELARNGIVVGTYLDSTDSAQMYDPNEEHLRDRNGKFVPVEWTSRIQDDEEFERTLNEFLSTRDNTKAR